MDLLEIDSRMAEIIPREDSASPSSPPERLTGNLPSKHVSADTAIELVSEAAAAIKLLEQESAHAVARAHQLAQSVIEKLELADARADRAEEDAEHKANENAQLLTQLDMTHKLLQNKEAQLESVNSDLRQSEIRAAAAEHRAEEAEAAIERIVETIRMQLPTRTEISKAR